MRRGSLARILADERAALPTHACEQPGCDEQGAHRAPRTPIDLRNYRWFCLEHVRAYNRAWNFFEGWTQSDIERFQRDDMTGHRPTWPFGSRKTLDENMSDMDSVFQAFAHEWFGANQDEKERARKARGANGLRDAELQDALAVLDLSPPVDLTSLKRRYKSLVKKHHPDANGGSRESEELLKQINQAYNCLLKRIS